MEWKREGVMDGDSGDEGNNKTGNTSEQSN